MLIFGLNRTPSKVSVPVPGTASPAASSDGDDAGGWPDWLKRLVRFLLWLGLSMAVIAALVWLYLHFSSGGSAASNASISPLSPTAPTPQNLPTPPAAPDLPKAVPASTTPATSLQDKYRCLATISPTQPDLEVFLSLLTTLAGNQSSLNAELRQFASTLVTLFGLVDCGAIIKFLEDTLFTDIRQELRELLVLLLAALADCSVTYDGVRPDLHAIQRYADVTMQPIVVQLTAVSHDPFLAQQFTQRVHAAILDLHGSGSVSRSEPLHRVRELIDGLKPLWLIVAQQAHRPGNFEVLAEFGHQLSPDHSTANLHHAILELVEALKTHTPFTPAQTTFFLDLVRVFTSAQHVLFIEIVEALSNRDVPEMLRATARFEELYRQLLYINTMGMGHLPSEFTENQMHIIRATVSFVDDSFNSPLMRRAQAQRGQFPATVCTCLDHVGQGTIVLRDLLQALLAKKYQQFSIC